MKNLPGLRKVLALSGALGLGATACDMGDDACGCGDEYSGPPQDLRPAFGEIEAECAGVFTGHAAENAGANGAVPCRYAAMSYSLEIHLTGDPACIGDEGGADCFYDVINPTPGELPSLDENGGEKDLGITYIGWRHEDFDQGDYLDWEHCTFVMEHHTPPG